MEFITSPTEWNPQYEIYYKPNRMESTICNSLQAQQNGIHNMKFITSPTEWNPQYEIHYKPNRMESTI